MKKDAKRTTIWLNHDIRALADRLCLEEDRSLSKIIQIALVNLAKSRDGEASAERKAA